MRTHIVVLNYPESDWGADIVEFAFDDYVSVGDLENEFSYAMEDTHSENFEIMQNYADAVCNKVAEALHGAWRYISTTCKIDILI